MRRKRADIGHGIINSGEVERRRKKESREEGKGRR